MFSETPSESSIRWGRFVLSILLMPKISNAFEKARMAGVKADLNGYKTAATAYFMKNDSEEKSAEGINDYLDSDLVFSNGLSKKENGWGNPYKIVVSTDKRSIEIITKNNDKEPKEYSLYVYDGKDGQTKTTISGLENDIIALDGDERKNQKELAKTKCSERTIEEDPEEDFVVVDVTDGVKITQYIGTSLDVVIPCKINGKNVVDIGNISYKGAFYSKNIRTVVLPDTLTDITGNGAFSSNQLTSIFIPSSVKTIASSAFAYNKITEVNLPEGMVKIGRSAFRENYLTSVKLPDTLTEIEHDSFSRNKIKDVKIPANITMIYDGSFQENEIETVEFSEPSKLVEIRYSAFERNKIKKIKLPSGSLKRMGSHVFENNQIEELDLGTSIEKIEDDSFAKNNIKKVIIPQTMQSLSYGVFNYNVDLKDVVNKSAISNSDLLRAFNSNPVITN